MIASRPSISRDATVSFRLIDVGKPWPLRIGGFIVVDLTDPAAPDIVQYLNNRDFSSSAIGPDSGPEVIDFVPAGHSPTGRDLVVVGTR